MSNETLLQFPTVPANRSARREFYESTAAASPLEVGYANTATAVAASPSRLTVEELYPEMNAIRPEIVMATRLLDSGLADLDHAISQSLGNETIGADDAVQRFEATLPELFACRVLGEGFASITNALVNALHNRQGELLSTQQIQKLRAVVANLKKQPFITFDEAVDDIMELERVGFVVEPQGFEALADWLIDE
jgi:hypothetical protein